MRWTLVPSYVMIVSDLESRDYTSRAPAHHAGDVQPREGQDPKSALAR